MGLIRKTLAVSTVGVVRPSSKKQRVAKATMKNTRATAQGTDATVRALEEQNRLLAQAMESARYAQQQQAVQQRQASAPSLFTPQPTNLVKSPDETMYLGPDGKWLPMPVGYTWDGFAWKAIPTLPGTP